MFCTSTYCTYHLQYSEVYDIQSFTKDFDITLNVYQFLSPSFSVSRNRETVLRINSVSLMCSIEDAKDRIGFEMRNTEDPKFD